MTVCNMAIEAGARAGLIAPDETTYAYLRGREFAPQDFDRAVEEWKKLPTDPGARYDRVECYQAADIQPQVTWGTNPGQVISVSDTVPDPAACREEQEQRTAQAALDYMDLSAGRSRRLESIACLSVPAPTRESRIFGRPLRLPAGTTSTIGSARWWYPGVVRSNVRRRKKDSIKSSARPVSIGARRAAVCVWP